MFHYLKGERLKRGLTRNDLSDKAKIPINRLMYIELNSDINIFDYLKFNEVKRIAKLFNKTIEELEQDYYREMEQFKN